MIKYSLICKDSHAFECWFSNAADYDTQQSQGLVTCPVCSSAQTHKAIMAPSIASKSNTKNASAQDTHSTPAALTAVPENFSKIAEQMKAFQRHVKENSENVGDNFTEEARKIHYGEAEKRGIYGQAAQDDVAELIDEGVEVLPLPTLPEDKN